MKQFTAKFDEACAALGRSTVMPDVSMYPEKKQKRLLADHVLETLLEYNNQVDNDGQPWVADVSDTTQRKYHPWFVVEQDEAADGGFRLSFDVGHCYFNGAVVGARYACKSSELAQFMGENCPDIYHDTLS